MTGHVGLVVRESGGCNRVELPRAITTEAGHPRSHIIHIESKGVKGDSDIVINGKLVNWYEVFDYDWGYKNIGEV